MIDMEDWIFIYHRSTPIESQMIRFQIFKRDCPPDLVRMWGKIQIPGPGWDLVECRRMKCGK